MWWLEGCDAGRAGGVGYGPEAACGDKLDEADIRLKRLGVAFGPLQTFVSFAAKGGNEPFLTFFRWFANVGSSDAKEVRFK